MLLVLLVGAGVGFLGGLLGKGGSAIATPMLVAIGVPPMIAVAAPLPATIPGTLLAADRYRRHSLVDRRVLVWSVAVGVPATILGAIATHWVTAEALIVVTDVVLALLGLRLLARPHRSVGENPPGWPEITHRTGLVGLVGVAAITGLAAGLLANSGGFLLAPLFITVLRLPVKPALGTSLVVAAALAVPGSLVHLALGHLDWRVVLVFGLGSIPLSSLGARIALRVDAQRLERFYGAALFLFGAGFLMAR